MNAKTAWYREPWPWLLAAGPTAVVIAGTVTAFIAFRGADGLVADDYYKQGLAINRVIARDAAARALGIRGTVAFEAGRVRAALVADGKLPDRIRLTLVNAARASADRPAVLARTADGDYSAPMDGLPAGRWTLVLETPEWRLEAPADLRAGPVIEIRRKTGN
jgi:hypothetical protein